MGLCTVGLDGVFVDGWTSATRFAHFQVGMIQLTPSTNACAVVHIFNCWENRHDEPWLLFFETRKSNPKIPCVGERTSSSGIVCG